jgi:hypothetical protein
MKLRVLLGALAWTLFITALHVSLNIGWVQLTEKFKVAIGTERAQLVVGFLPVT